MVHPKVKEFLSEAGKKGGSSTSERKKQASRKNGKLAWPEKEKKEK